MVELSRQEDVERHLGISYGAALDSQANLFNNKITMEHAYEYYHDVSDRGHYFMSDQTGNPVSRPEPYISTELQNLIANVHAMSTNRSRRGF